MITASRYHDFSAGHRVAGHENKCAQLHGHNYRAHFTIAAMQEQLDSVGRVIDFSMINQTLCAWLETNWDHKFLAWEEDPVMIVLDKAMNLYPRSRVQEQNEKVIEAYAALESSIVWTPFNPTAENIAKHLLRIIGPSLLSPHGVSLISVRIDETRKCSAEATL